MNCPKCSGSGFRFSKCPNCGEGPWPHAEAQAQGGGEVVAWHIQHEDGLVALSQPDSVDWEMREQAEADGLSFRPLVFGDKEAAAMPLIRKCKDALAEELAAWDINPPLAHVKDAHDACIAFLSGDTAPPSAPVGVVAEAADFLRDLLRFVKLEAGKCESGNDRHFFDSQAKEIERVIAALAQQPAAVDGAMPRHGSDAGDGLKYVLCQVGFGSHYGDMLLVPHADGQYVTAAKLQPFTMKILRAALAAQPGGSDDG